MGGSGGTIFFFVLPDPFFEFLRGIVGRADERRATVGV